jgi:hypothetical protein
MFLLFENKFQILRDFLADTLKPLYDCVCTPVRRFYELHNKKNTPIESIDVFHLFLGTATLTLIRVLNSSHCFSFAFFITSG